MPAVQPSKTSKPLGTKAYGSIPHLPGSRLGPGDHMVSSGQAAICIQKVRDRHDEIIVTEKLDGSNCAVAKIHGQLVPLTRAGYPAISSPYTQHRLFHTWVWHQWSRFDAVLRDGEWIVGEWLAQAHGTRYALPHEPFVVFDLIQGHDAKRGFRRLPYDALLARIGHDFVRPALLHRGSAFSIAAVQQYYRAHGSGHGAQDSIEGAVWRVERQGAVDFLAKWVGPDKVDGQYLPELTGGEPVWNWTDWPSGFAC